MRTLPDMALPARGLAADAHAPRNDAAPLPPRIALPVRVTTPIEPTALRFGSMRYTAELSTLEELELQHRPATEALAAGTATAFERRFAPIPAAQQFRAPRRPTARAAAFSLPTERPAAPAGAVR